jgi:DNA-binding transcriptional LysR family regulator
MRGPKFREMCVFETICRLRSFASAGKGMHISASAVSQTLG